MNAYNNSLYYWLQVLDRLEKQHCCSMYAKNLEYVTFDDPLVLKEAIEETNLFLINNKPPLLIDEVQYAPEIFRYLKMYVDKHKIKGSFALTGFQAFELMKNVSETLAGRMAIIELKGLSLREMYGIECYRPFVPNEEYMEEKNLYLIIRIFGKRSIEDPCLNFKISLSIGIDTIHLM